MRFILKKARYKPENAVVVDTQIVPGEQVEVKTSAESSVSYAAELVGDDNEFHNGSEYQLFVGHDPDKIASGLLAGMQEGRIQFKIYNRERKDWEPSGLLFQGTLGYTSLFLNEDVERGETRTLLRIDIYVCNQKKEKYFDEMVKDLLRGDRPHFVCDDFLWQMWYHRFLLSWKDGYASYNDPYEELNEVVKFTDRFNCLLSCILRNPITCLVRTPVLVPLARVKRLGCVERRSILRKMTQIGCRTFSQLGSGNRVSSTRLRQTHRNRAHMAIVWFLDRLRLRLESVHEKIEADQKNLKNELDGLKTFMDKPENKNNKELQRIKGDQKIEKVNKLNSLNESSKKACECLRLIRRIRLNAIFSECHSGTPLFEVGRSLFDVNADYARACDMMYEFIRSRFWWIHDKDSDHYRTPQIDLDEENGETRLEKKYSMVYENWCWAMLIDAFLTSGYSWKSGREQANQDGASCEFEKGVLSVCILHGGIEIKKRPKDGDTFKLEKIRKSTATPDFLLCFENKDTRVKRWMVLDSKSDDVLKTHMENRRYEYASIKWRSEDGVWKPIHQVWLI